MWVSVDRLGKIEIAPEVIQIIAGLAAVQVDGVAGMSGGSLTTSPNFSAENPRQGIRVSLRGLSIGWRSTSNTVPTFRM